MKKIVLSVVSAFLLGFTLYSCSPSDKDIQTHVSPILSDYTDVNAEVKDGVVTLSGEVVSDVEKNQIQEMLSSVKGVKSVVNNLTVKPPVVIDHDAEIGSAISSALQSAGFKTVNVAVNNGEVTLTGDLKKSDLVKVMQIANESKPKKVINELKVK